MLINIDIIDRFNDKFTAIYFTLTLWAGYWAVVQGQSRKENPKTAPQCCAGNSCQTEEFFCGVKISALHWRTFAKIHIPFSDTVLRWAKIELIRLSVVAGPFLRCLAAFSEWCQWSGKPCSPFGCVVTFNLFDLAAVAKKHHRLELEGSFQAISRLCIHGFRIIGRIELCHAFLFYAWPEKLQRKLRDRERNFQEYVALLQYLAGRRIKSIRFHATSLHQVHRYSTSPLLMNAAGGSRFLQRNEVSALLVAFPRECNETLAPVPLFLETEARYGFYARFVARHV